MICAVLTMKCSADVSVQVRCLIKGMGMKHIMISPCFSGTIGCLELKSCDDANSSCLWKLVHKYLLKQLCLMFNEWALWWLLLWTPHLLDRLLKRTCGGSLGGFCLRGWV